ncbi:PHP domain-containing protein, partial [Halomonas elongata]
MPMNALPERFEGEALSIDLHMHSTASDGALSPEALVEACAARGLTHMALTDHDTVAGVERASAAGERHGVVVLPGTELSCQWRGLNIHVVGLLPSGVRGELSAGLEYQAEAREHRALQIAARMERVGLENALDRAREQAGSDRPLGRPDFAKAMVAAELVPDMATAFRRYLGNGKAGDIKAHWPVLSTVVGWVLDAGGVATLAH